jgi:hypothetical protein
MTVYQTNGQWFAGVRGGIRNSERLPAEVRGPFATRPEPTATWRADDSSSSSGSASVRLTQFAAGEERFTVQAYSWSPAYGYCAEEAHETFVDALPPVIGESFQWAGDHWEPVRHPQES